jgi:6-phosphogluconolactonase (cycloisomerase 2 family)
MPQGRGGLHLRSRRLQPDPHSQAAGTSLRLRPRRKPAGRPPHAHEALIAISPKGDLALAILLRGSNADKKAFYYNKNGAAVVLKIDGKKVTRVGNEIELGGLPEGVAFSPDGAYAYVGNYLDSNLAVLKVDGTGSSEAEHAVAPRCRPIA